MRRMFIRYCVRSGMNRLKRYCFGKVFSRSDSLGMKCFFDSFFWYFDKFFVSNIKYVEYSKI